jgi:hypothetical protein
VSRIKYTSEIENAGTGSHLPGHKRRRQLMAGGIALGAILPILPSNWSRPVVQSVLLPAHAQTSTVAPVSEEGSVSDASERNAFTIGGVSVAGDCGTRGSQDVKSVDVRCSDFEGGEGSDEVLFTISVLVMYNSFSRVYFAGIFVSVGGNISDNAAASASCVEPGVSDESADLRFGPGPCGEIQVTANLVADAVNGTASVSDITVVPL